MTPGLMVQGENRHGLGCMLCAHNKEELFLGCHGSFPPVQRLGCLLTCHLFSHVLFGLPSQVLSLGAERLEQHAVIYKTRGTQLFHCGSFSIRIKGVGLADDVPLCQQSRGSTNKWQL